MNKIMKIAGIVAGIVVLPLVLSLAVSSGESSEKKLPEFTPIGAPLPPDYGLVKKVAFSRFPGEKSEEMLAFLKDNYALEMNDVEKLSGWKANEAVEHLTQLIIEARELKKLAQVDPEMFKMMKQKKGLERKASMTAYHVRKAADDNRQKKLEELQKILDDAFDLRQKLMVRDVERMEKELGALKSLVSRRAEGKEAIVAHRVKEMTGENEHLTW